MELGKCLVFHLVYLPEMKRLYWKDGAPQGEDFEGLDDPEKTKEMLKAVGDQSCQEAAAFLEKCGEEIKKHFSAVGNYRPIDSRNMEKKWYLSYGIYPKEKIKPGTWRMKAGVVIPKNGSNEIIAWLWGRHGVESEEKMANYPGLKSHIQAGSEELGMEAGTVALGRIKIFDSEPVGFSVKTDRLLKEVAKAFSVITQEDFPFLYPK